MGLFKVLSYSPFMSIDTVVLDRRLVIAIGPISIDTVVLDRRLVIAIGHCNWPHLSQLIPLGSILLRQETAKDPSSRAQNGPNSLSAT